MRQHIYTVKSEKDPKFPSVFFLAATGAGFLASEQTDSHEKYSWSDRHVLMSCPTWFLCYPVCDSYCGTMTTHPEIVALSSQFDKCDFWSEDGKYSRYTEQFRSSPTGLLRGKKSNFGRWYRGACYMCVLCLTKDFLLKLHCLCTCVFNFKTSL